jgi:nicotinamide riboside transporter PnuC
MFASLNPSSFAEGSERTVEMPANLMSETKRILEPMERISEFLFGLIMVLTLTCTFDARAANRGSVRTMFLEVLGCNLAWGIIDAFFYLLNCLGQRTHNIALLAQLRKSSNLIGARRSIADALPPLVASLLEPQELESLRVKLTRIPESTVWPRLERQDWLNALGVFLLVFLAMFPMVIPFIFFSSALQAKRFSYGIALILLFLAGYTFGRLTNSNPWRAGLAMVIFGVAIVTVAILLGG